MPIEDNSSQIKGGVTLEVEQDEKQLLLAA